MLCGHPFKELVNTILKEIEKYQNNKFSVGSKILFALLSGEKKDIIINLDMINDPYYDYINSKDRNKFFSLLNSLKENGIISIDNNNYGKINLIKTKLEDNDYKIILGSVKF